MRNKIYYSAILAIMLVFCGMSAVFCQEKPVKDSGSLYSELEALAQKRNSAAVLEYVAEQQTKFQLSESDKYLLNMLNAGIKAGTDIQSIAYAVPPADMTQAVRSKIHFKVAKLFMHLRDYKKADYYGRTEPALRPGYKVIIVDEAPIGVYGWKNSSFVKDASKRETRFANYNEAGAAVLFVAVYISLMGYAGDRVTAWLHPEEDPRDTGYQILQSLYAIGSGGFLGLGLGKSRQKYLYLPFQYNDYIFAIICEELGFLGAVMIVLLFGALILRGYWIALRAPDRFSTVLAAGLITLIAVQTVLNLGVVTNLLPSTGVALPFFSYGGTALAVNLGEMGVLLGISRYRKAVAPQEDVL